MTMTSLPLQEHSTIQKFAWFRAATPLRYMIQKEMASVVPTAMDHIQ